MDWTGALGSMLLVSEKPEREAELSPCVQTGLNHRVRVDGKFFQRGGQRFRVQGATYGPFAPDPNGEQFPSLQRVKADFELMTAASMNSLRLYHSPPPWLLE